MPRNSKASHLAAALCLAASSGASAQVNTYDDYNIRGEICIGASCPFSAYSGSDGIRMIESANKIFISDTSTAGGYPGNNWRLLFNDDFQNGESYFGVQDATAGVTSLRVEAGAPEYALNVNSDGMIGIGTSVPSSSLHIVTGQTPSLRLERDGSMGDTPQSWVHATNPDYLLIDYTALTTPFLIRAGAPSQSFQIDALGNVALGAASPDAALHIERANGTAQMRIEETSGTQTARPLLNMINHGRPDIVMANTATGGEWAFGAGTNFVLKTGTIGSSDGDKTLHFKLFGATGDLEITGQIITGGGTCGGGCDAVFSEGYDLPSIEDHAAEMFALGHLPNVGPTIENEPINVSDKLGRMLNELEHAHIYIARQQAEITALKADHAARLAALEAELRALRARE